MYKVDFLLPGRVVWGEGTGTGKSQWQPKLNLNWFGQIKWFFGGGRRHVADWDRDRKESKKSCVFLFLFFVTCIISTITCKNRPFIKFKSYKLYMYVRFFKKTHS